MIWVLPRSIYKLQFFYQVNFIGQSIVLAPFPRGVRMKERGYYQAALFAPPLALYSGLPFIAKAHPRIRETRASELDFLHLNRDTHVNSAFISDEGIVKYKKVLIVDDISTTGAIIHWCALALHAAGSQEGYGLMWTRACLLFDHG